MNNFSDTTIDNLAPDVGTIFAYQGHQYRVVAWLKRKAPLAPQADWITEILYKTQQEIGPDRVRLEFCTREEAEYVEGAGVCGVIERVSDLVIVEKPQTTNRLDADREFALSLVGRSVD